MSPFYTFHSSRLWLGAALLCLFTTLTQAQTPTKIALYRWNFKNDWADARNDETDRFLELGYTHRTLVGYIYREPAAGTVALNRWHLVKTDDWVTVLETVSADMVRFGYTDKVLLGYAYPNPQANTIPVNRWYLEKTGDWVTVPESASADMQRFGYVSKTLVAYTPQ